MTRIGIVLGAAALLTWSGAAAAAMLDQEACARLKTELMQLELAGARGNMAKGPDWAKVNLSSDKLDQIKRLIEVDEQILFRCQGKPLVVLPEGVDADAPPERNEPGAKPAPDGKAQAKEARQPTSKAPAKAAAPTAAKAPAPGAAKAPTGKAPPAKAAAESQASPAPKPKPKPAVKPKADDAYKPPPVAPAADPFVRNKN